jgi:hypothetical protein
MTTTATHAHVGPLTANGVTPIPFDFQAISESEVNVVKDGVDIGNVGFTVALEGDGTGEITPLTSWGSSEVYIYSAPDFENTAEFQRFVKWYADAVNVPLDVLSRQIIALRRDVGRTFRVPIGNTGLVSGETGVIGVEDGNLVLHAPGEFVGPPGSLAVSGLIFVTPQQFGAEADGVTDDSAAFVAALAYLKSIAVNQSSGFYQASPRLYVPAGHYYMGTTTLDITHTLIIEGEGTGLASGGKASKLRWDAGATGIRVQRYDTIGDDDEQAGGFNAGDSSIIRGLYLEGGYDGAGTEGEFHGIHLRARAVIEDVSIHLFEGDGIYANTTAGGAPGANPEGVVNLSVINRVSITECRNGLFWDGADSNANLIQMLDVRGNRKWGVLDSSFLGNTYVGCHAAGNGWDGALGSIPTAATLSGNRYYPKPGQDANWGTTSPTGTTADNAVWGYIAAGGVYNGVAAWVGGGQAFREGGAYKTDNANAANIFLGCYSEGDQNPSQFVAPTIAIGGLHGAQVKGTGVYLTTQVNGGIGALRAAMFGALNPATGLGTLIATDRLEFSNASNQLTFEWAGADLAATVLRSLVSSNFFFAFLGETTTNPVGKRHVDFMNGFGLGSKKVFPGTAVPGAGAYVVGDRIVRTNTPVGGGPDEWVCVTAGSPGTWRATKWVTGIGATAARPALTASDVGVTYLDTTLAAAGKPIWWTGTAWVDATGVAV